MITVFPGWYIRVTRKSFLSKAWEVRFWDGVSNTEIRYPSAPKNMAEHFAQSLLERICKDMLESTKEEAPEKFDEILGDSNTVWKTDGPMGVIPLGKIAQKLYPEATEGSKEPE